MPLRFRSVIPYTLPGVLALIGCWWYISRKKDRISGHDGPEGTPPAIDFLSSPSEASNGLVERVSCASPLHGGVSDAPAKEAPGQVQALETKASPVPPHSPAAAAETPPPRAIHTSSQDTPGAASSGADGCSAFPALERRDLAVARGRPTAALFDEPAARHRADVAAEATGAALSCRSAPARYYTSPASGHLCSDAERPEPEGEVASQAVTVPCRTPPLKDLRDTTTATTKDALLPPRGPVQSVAGPEVEPQEAPPSPQVSHHHHHALTGTSTSPGPAHSPAPDSALASEDDSQLPQWPVVVDEDDKREFELLAAGLITEVISAATLEVLGDDCPGDGCPDAGPSGSSTPRANGRPLHRPPRTPTLFQLEGASPVSCGSGEEMQLGLPNGFSPCRPGEVGAQVGGVRSSSHRPPLPSTGEPEGDSACCSTCHYGDGSEALQSSWGDLHREDLHREDLHRGELQEDLQAGLVLGGEASRAETPPQEEEEEEEAASEALAAENAVHAVFDLKRFNGVGLGNGIGEVETDQSGGSDVNSMDSVDSGCTMGPGETTSATSSGLELVIWEVEVPKHLVGRLIGKQGRYVSFLKQNSGAKIYISTLPYTQEFQICHIEGTRQQVDKALSLIGKKFKDLDLTNLYAPPPPTLPSLPMTSWLLLPSGVTVEVIVVNIVSAGHVFVQQHTHPTYHALRSLDQQMFLCYSQPGTPGLPSPAEVGVICAAPAQEGAWWRSQVITFYKEANEVEIRYVDYGGYDRVKIDSLRQIRSDFVTLPFQGAEVLLDNIAPLPGEDRFSTEATSALEEITRGVALLAQVSNYDNNTGLPLVQLWNMAGDELISVNRTLVERGLGTWVDSF